MLYCRCLRSLQPRLIFQSSGTSVSSSGSVQSTFPPADNMHPRPRCQVPSNLPRSTEVASSPILSHSPPQCLILLQPLLVLTVPPSAPEYHGIHLSLVTFYPAHDTPPQVSSNFLHTWRGVCLGTLGLQPVTPGTISSGPSVTQSLPS